jgi:hypothetical protein
MIQADDFAPIDSKMTDRHPGGQCVQIDDQIRYRRGGMGYRDAARRPTIPFWP